MAKKLKTFDVRVEHTIYCNYSVVAENEEDAYKQIGKHKLEQLPIKDFNKEGGLKKEVDYISIGDVQVYVEESK
jgi:hypothetical protein